MQAALQATGRALAGEVRAMDNRAIPALQKLLQKVLQSLFLVAPLCQAPRAPRTCKIFNCTPCSTGK